LSTVIKNNPVKNDYTINEMEIIIRRKFRVEFVTFSPRLSELKKNK